MSHATPAARGQAPARANQRTQAQIIAAQARRRGGGMGGPHGMGGVGEKAMHFWPSLKRLLRELGPQKALLGFVVVIGIASVVANVLSPKLLIHATNEMFAGFVSNQVTGTMKDNGIQPDSPLLELKDAAGNPVAPGTTWDQVSLGQFLGAMRDGSGQPTNAAKAMGLAMALNQAGAKPSTFGIAVSPDAWGQLTPAQLFGAAQQNPQLGAALQQIADKAAEGGTPDMSGTFTMMGGMDQTRALTGIDFGVFGHWLLIVGALYLTGALFGFGQGFVLARVINRTVYAMREKISAKIDRLPLKYFDGQPRGELLSRVTNDMDNIQQSLQQSVSSVLNSVLTVIGVAVMMFTISWQLALITIAVVPVAGVVSALIGKRAQKRFVAMWTHTGELNSQVEEGYTGHALVKVFGRRHEADERFKETNEQLFRSAFGAQFLSSTLMPLNNFIGNINYVAVMLVGALKVASGTLQLGDVTSFIQYSRMFTQPIAQIASLANMLQSGVASAERVFEVLDEPEQTADGDGTLPEPLQGHVEFRGVTFAYDPEHPLIEGLDLEAEPGQMVAIVGETGAGKTTLVNLLMRFYDLQGGHIFLDGVDTATVPRGRLRGEFGMVLQDTWLFSGTIMDNIAYGDEDASPEALLEAAKAAYVDRFVHALPDGYETVIDDEGSNLSAGEKQLLTIARAFVHDPAVLILDEATSSVDTRTEVLVQQAMARLRAGRTSFVIAHRLSTIRDADTIVVMDHGRIVEQGDHDELLAAGGAYARLYWAQFNAVAQDEEALAGAR